MIRLVEFFEAPLFSKLVYQYLSDDEYRELQLHLANDPEAGAVIPGTGGFRKMRWADSRRGKGKRGGLPVIYYSLLDETSIWLMTLYGKDEAADLTPQEKRILKAAIDEEKRYRLQARRKKGLSHG